MMKLAYNKTLQLIIVALASVTVAFLAGCSTSTEHLETRHGRSSGSVGSRSVNGLHVFAGMFQQRGWDVIRGRTTRKKFDEATVLVWAPDDFQPPSVEERKIIEDWLAAASGRTAIYIGRDYDAAPGYWKSIAESAPIPQAEEITRRQAEAQAYHDSERGNMPQEEYAGWFTFKRDGPPQRVTKFGGAWADTIDAEATNIWIEGELLPPSRLEMDDAFDDFTEAVDDENIVLLDGFDVDVDEEELEETRWFYQRQSEFEFYILLSVSEQDGFAEEDIDGTPLIMSVEHLDWDASDVLVIANGSFLLNLPLVNHQHRNLAGEIVDYCGEPGTAIFWEGTMLTSSSSQAPPSEQSLLTTWPVNFILFHLALLGFLYCLWKFPIFGRPRKLPQSATSEFGTHIEALGELMEATKQRDYAQQRLAAYREVVKSE